jgi:hypothetical protein
MSEGFCTLCSASIESFEGLARCPKCGTDSQPCSNDNQINVKINLHELRILCIWAENWADKCYNDSDVTGRNKMMPELIKAITARLRPQIGNGIPITMRDEMELLTKVTYPNLASRPRVRAGGRVDGCGLNTNL